MANFWSVDSSEERCYSVNGKGITHEKRKKRFLCHSLNNIFLTKINLYHKIKILE